MPLSKKKMRELKSGERNVKPKTVFVKPKYSPVLQQVVEKYHLDVKPKSFKLRSFSKEEQLK